MASVVACSRDISQLEGPYNRLAMVRAEMCEPSDFVRDEYPSANPIALAESITREIRRDVEESNSERA